MGWLERADERNQKRAERDQEVMGGPSAGPEAGPRWAWALASLPFVGWIGNLVIVASGGREAIRRRRET